MEADVTTPEQRTVLASELFDTPLEERGRRQGRCLGAGARTSARRGHRATSRRLERPGRLLARHGALRAPARAHRRRLRQLSGRFTGDGGPALPVAAEVCLGTDTLANAETSTSDRGRIDAADNPHLPLSGVVSMGKLQGKVAVITGGTTGIGLAAAKLFVAEGAYVFITGRRQKELDNAVHEIGDNVSGVQGDVTNLADLDRLYETVKTKGRVDIVFANAGLAELAPLDGVTEEHFDKIFNINVKGALFTVQKALPLLNDGGSIILTGSVASVKGTAAFAVYGASKAAIRNFVRGWTVELKDRRIRSNVLSPGPIATPLLMATRPQDTIEKITSTIPMGRLGETDEVAKAALFLASDDSSFVTGIELFVDGGRAQI
jgi:NAD(P)-dependent dehydrogenase (short-subunit alcohol dehydrogenase family)